MSRSIRTCYMCGALSTSKEHVPPKALFPEKSDLEGGLNLRKSLIKVPSCDLHNSCKSDDDEYLMRVLTLGYQNNPTAKTQIKTKLFRAFHRDSSLVRWISGCNIQLQVEDTLTSLIQDATAIKVDMNRIKNAFDHIGRGLYFHQFNKRWHGKIQCCFLFLLELTDASSQTKNENLFAFGLNLEKALANQKTYGQNPEVFTYQFIQEPPEFPVVMLLNFYQGSKVVLLFKN